jgi:hypothetical protein
MFDWQGLACTYAVQQLLLLMCHSEFEAAYMGRGDGDGEGTTHALLHVPWITAKRRVGRARF